MNDGAPGGDAVSDNVHCSTGTPWLGTAVYWQVRIDRVGWVCARKLPMKRLKKLALVLIVPSQLNGCASLYTQSHDAYADAKVGCADSKTIPNVYSGFVFDLYCLPAENAGFFCLVDLPLSLVVDSVILPYTVYKQSKYGSWYRQDICREKNETYRSLESVAPRAVD